MTPGRFLTAALAAWALAAAPGWADPAAVVSDRPESVALTVYQDSRAESFTADRDEYEAPEYDPSLGLALVSEWRTIEVQAGESLISFRGVAEGIVPQTAALDGLPAELVESNQDYDLLSPASLISRSVGAPVKRITTNPVTGKETVEDAIIRSGPKGVVLEVGGRFEALGCGGQPQRLVFDRPPGLTDRPTLTLRVRVRTAGRYRVRLSYLATGLMWRARYVMTLDKDARRIDLAGWISLINTSGTTFADAPTQVVAGDVERSDTTQPALVEADTVEPKCWPMDTTTRGRALLPKDVPTSVSAFADSDVEAIVVTGSRIVPNYQDVPLAVASQSELGDYKLYSLPYPTTVAGRQTKQVMMLVRPGIKVTWYDGAAALANDEFDASDETEYAGLALKTLNTRDNGLGVPLPGGKVSLYQTQDQGSAALVGESGMMTAAVGLPVRLGVGDDPWVRIKRVTLSKAKKGDQTERRNQVEIFNDGDQAVRFEYELGSYDDDPYRVTAQSRPSRRSPQGTVWTLQVPARGRAVLTYSVLSDY
jgi:hypothetical protein